MAHKVEEPAPQRKDPQVIWSGNEALQLPKISGRHGFDRRPCSRSDFTEIEIPALLPQYTSTNDLHTPQINSSYQLFPAKNLPSPIPPRSAGVVLKYQEQTPQPRDTTQGKRAVQDSILPEKNLVSLYMNHSAIMREKTKRDQHHLPEKTGPVHTAKMPSPLPYAPKRPALPQTAVPWVVEQQPPGPTGDNSLTALQIAKSLSEVDFFPTEHRGPSVPKQRLNYRNGPTMHGGRGWAKEVGQRF